MKFTDCTGLPDSWNNVKLTVGFPVEYETKVTVICEEGYSKMSGDDDIVCQGGNNYKYNNEPVCKQGK